MSVTELSKLTGFYGIGTDYSEFGRGHVQISEQAQWDILHALRPELVEHEATLQSSKDFLESRENIIPPVCMVRPDQPITFNINISDSQANMQWEWLVTTEQGESIRGLLSISEREPEPDAAFMGSGFESRVATLNGEFPEGYHQLQLNGEGGRVLAEMTLMVVPSECYRPPSLVHNKKIFGLSVQLYSLRSKRNWGMGDFSDLKLLVQESARCGVDIIGVNPLHALFPANPMAFSPYSPSNRSFLNVFYIDPEAVHEFATCESARSLFNSESFKNDMESLRKADYVDYAWVGHNKKIFFELLFSEFKKTDLNHGTPRDQLYRNYVLAQGAALRLHATYDALHEFLFAQNSDMWGWPVWPLEFRNPLSEAVRKFADNHQERIDYHQYLQWCATEQLKDVQQTAEQCGMEVGLYLDIAVGVDMAGSEAWSNQELFCFAATAGAPPDELAPEGQNWGFPPFRPLELRESAYDLFVKNIRANMVNSGAVRFDHCVSLLRLWWVPEGKSAKNGAYVHYDLGELIGLLALESQRNHCLVIGEDLGTVPDTLPAVMRENSMYCYRVLYFEKGDNHVVLPEHYPELAVATINTHDVAPLASWWSMSDIELRRELSVIVGADVISRLCWDRGMHKQLLLDALHQKGFLHEPRAANQIPDLPRDIVDAIHLYLASSRAAIVISQLEDWQGMASAVNVPGTHLEHRNWQRKLEQPIEGFFDIPENADLARRIRDVRL